MSERKPLRSRKHYRAWRPIATRWMDNDIYGHASAVVYYSWFDTAVNAWLVEQKLLDIERGALIGLVVETGCTYARPIAFPSEVQAGISVSHIGNSSVRYDVGLFLNGNPHPAAEGFFTHCYVDRLDRRPRSLDDRWRATLETIASFPVALRPSAAAV